MVAGLVITGFFGSTVKSAEKPAGEHKREHKAEYLDKEHAPKGKGWVKLFDGKDTTGWKLRDTKRETSWKVTDGILANKSTHEHPGVDIYTEKTFDDFEIYYEYKTEKDTNSGLYLRGRYEIQIFDDFGQKPSPETNGAIYSLTAPSENASKKPGEWQSVFATIHGRKVNVWLNGKHVVDNFEVKHATGLSLDQEEAKPGPILIQGNHGSVEFRHVLIKPMKSEK